MRIVIDTDRIGHAFRRAWLRLTGRGTKPNTCADCGDDLTPDEAKYYGISCELCEGIRYHGMDL